MTDPGVGEARGSGGEPFVRPMRAEDLRAVCGLWMQPGAVAPEGIDDFPALSVFLERNPKTNMVVEDDDRIVGAVLCGEDGRAGFVHRVVLRPEHRSEAVIALALRRAMLRLRSLGITRCILLEGRFCHTVEIGRGSPLGFGHAVAVLTDCVAKGLARESHRAEAPEDGARRGEPPG